MVTSYKMTMTIFVRFCYEVMYGHFKLNLSLLRRHYFTCKILFVINRLKLRVSWLDAPCILLYRNIQVTANIL